MIRKNGTLKWGAPFEPRELPHEWVLRELDDANLEDDAVVLDLITEYGVIAWPYFQPGYVPVERHGRMTPWPPVRHADWWRTNLESTVEDARWWLRSARALAGVWRETQFGGDPLEPWLAEGFLATPLHDPEQGCWSRFAKALNVGLEPFHAHVELADAGEFTVGLYSAPVGRSSISWSKARPPAAARAPPAAAFRTPAQRASSIASTTAAPACASARRVHAG